MKFMELNLQIHIYAHFVAKPLNISQMRNISLHCPNKNAEKSHTFPSSGKKCKFGKNKSYYNLPFFLQALDRDQVIKCVKLRET